MPRIKQLFIAVAAALLAIGLFREILITPLRAVGDKIFTTPARVLWRSGVGLRAVFSRDAAALEEKAAKLEVERNRLIIENAALKDIRVENARLADLLQFKKRSEAPFKTAAIVSGSLIFGVHTVTIDVGSVDGVEVGDAVVASDGILVGKVRETRGTSSVVQLITDSRSKLAAEVSTAEEKTVSGVAEGGHGEGVSLRLLPQGETLRPGDVAVTSGLEPGVPRGLLIGTIESVKQEVNEPFQSAFLQTLIDFDSLSTVAVVLAPR